MKLHPLRNEAGVILVIALIFVCILAIAGTMAYQMTASELNIARNFDASKEALSSANAGVEEARARMRLPSTIPPATTINPDAIYDPATPPSTSWTTFILATASSDPGNDPDYSGATITNSLQTDPDLEYWVKIQHKTDADNNIIYYGCDDPLTNGNLTIARTPTPGGYRPIDIITAYGIAENGNCTIQAEVAYDPGPPILAALYAEWDVDADDTATYPVTISGLDNCTSGSCPMCGTVNKQDLYVYADPSSSYPNLDPWPTNTTVSQAMNLNVYQGILSLKVWKTSASPSDCYNSAYNICYYSGDLTVTAPTGSGVLLVEGNLTLEGTFWDGLILVNGDLLLNGSSGINIQGAVLVNGRVWINSDPAKRGSVAIHYNSCAIDAALSSIPLRVLSWEDISMMP